jgi:hypothetical protein
MKVDGNSGSSNDVTLQDVCFKQVSSNKQTDLREVRKGKCSTDYMYVRDLPEF